MGPDCSVKVKSIFNRTTATAVNQLSDTLWQVECKMWDVFHDLTVFVNVDTTKLVIEQAWVDYRRFPHVNCPLFGEQLRQLEGVTLTKGLTKAIIQVCGGSSGCVNIKNMLLSSLPLILNAYITRDCQSYEEIAEKTAQLLQGTCIAFSPAKE